MKFAGIIRAASLISIGFVSGVGPGMAEGKLDCLPKGVVECSMPFLVKLLTNVTGTTFNKVFEDACVIHDYCYRFGAATYNHSRLTCDNHLRTDMREICDPDSGWEVGVAVVTAGISVGACRTAANTYYQAVRKGGKSAFVGKKQGKVCPYKSDPNIRDHRSLKPKVRDHRTK